MGNIPCRCLVLSPLFLIDCKSYCVVRLLDETMKMNNGRTLNEIAYGMVCGVWGSWRNIDG